MKPILGTLLSVVFLGAGCRDEPVAPVADDLELVVVAGDGQVGRCYSELPQPVVVEVRDPVKNKVVPGRTVNFRVLQGDGWVFGGAVLTDSRGRAADYWTLGGPGPQMLEARAVTANGLKEVFGRFAAFAGGTDPGERSLNSPGATTGQRVPAIYENRVVYVRTTWPVPNGFTFDGVYLYDLNTGIEQAVSTVHPTGGVEGLAIHGDRIVWQEDRGQARFDIYLYDLTTQTEENITAQLPGDWHGGPFRRPAVYGNRIVWLEDPLTIMVYDIATRGWTSIALSGGGSPPSIYGDRIVWDEFQGTHKIYMDDLGTGERRQIAPYPSNQLRPRIWGDRIVFIDDRHVSGDVFVYNLVTDELSRISDDPTAEFEPTIQGDRVVWWDYRSGHAELYFHDLATRAERRLASTSVAIGGVPYSPAIWGDRIVWGGFRAAQAPEEIRLYELGVCSRPAP